MKNKRNMKVFLVVMFMISILEPLYASGNQIDLYWGIREGDRISYRYYGIYYDSVYVNGSWELVPFPFDEQIYVQIDDLTRTPYPLDGNVPAVTPYWANGTPFSETSFSLLSDFIKSNIGILGPFALKLGNWTFFEKFTLDAIDDTFDEIYNNQIGWVNETPTIWNFTLVRYYYYNSSFITPFITINKQYSKSDGVLVYSSTEVEVTMNGVLKITRMPSSPSLVILVSVGFGGVVVIGILVILWKRRL